MKTLCALAAALAASAMIASSAGAAPFVGTNGSSILVRDTNNLTAAPVTLIPVTGLEGGETLVGIDQRPGTGELVGIGSLSHVYTIDPLTGAASPVGVGGAFTLNGTA